MLADTLSALLNGQSAPTSARVWESTRFCIDTRRTNGATENGLKTSTIVLFAAMIEWEQHRGIEAIATVTDLHMERNLRRTGWRLARLGEPQQIGTTKAVAGLLPVTDEALVAVCAIGKICGPVIHAPSYLALAA